MKLTRHNGRAGKNGVYNPKHNDRRFGIENSEHIDADEELGVPLPNPDKNKGRNNNRKQTFDAESFWRR